MTSNALSDRISPPPGTRIEQEPLVPYLEDDDADFADDELEPPSNTEGGQPGVWIWLLICSASISGLLFGYDTAIISSALVSLSKPPASSPIPALTTAEKSIITSITSLSALFSSLIAGPVADTIGRKPSILISAFIFVLGALWQALAPTVTQIIVGRFIVGLGVGYGSAIIPIYITELSPTHLRGRLITMNAVLITFGQVVAYLVGYAYSGTEMGWRTMFALGAVPAIIQILLLFVLPESPRYLVAKGYREKAGLVLAKVYGFSNSNKDAVKSRKVVEKILKSIERGVKREHGDVRLLTKCKMLISSKTNRKALYISGGLQALQQLCGFNALMYFSATIYAKLNFHEPTLPSLTVAITNFIFTILSLILIPKLGKRFLLLFTIPVMIVSLICAGYAFSFVPGSQMRSSPLPRSSLASYFTLRSSSIVSPSTSTPDDSAAPYFILIFTTIYVAAYAAGLGNIPWQQSELFTLTLRGLGSSIATSCNWSANVLVGGSFLGLTENLGAPWTFVGFAGVCAIGWYGIWRGYPNTEGVGLENVEDVL